MRYILAIAVSLIASFSGCGGGEGDNKGDTKSDLPKAPKRSELAKTSSMNEERIQFFASVFHGKGLSYVEGGTNDLKDPDLAVRIGSIQNEIASLVPPLTVDQISFSCEGSPPSICRAILRPGKSQTILVEIGYAPGSPAVTLPTSPVAIKSLATPADFKKAIEVLIDPGVTLTGVLVCEYFMTGAATADTPISGAQFELTKTLNS